MPDRRACIIQPIMEVGAQGGARKWPWGRVLTDRLSANFRKFLQMYSEILCTQKEFTKHRVCLAPSAPPSLRHWGRRENHYRYAYTRSQIQHHKSEEEEAWWQGVLVEKLAATQRNLEEWCMFCRYTFGLTCWFYGYVWWEIVPHSR
jgi:hypothetical protein